MQVLKISGSFIETLNATSTAPNTTFGQTTIVPINFFQLIDQGLKGYYGSPASPRSLYSLELDYWVGINLRLLSLSAYYELPSKLLAGFVNIEDDDSDGVKTQKLLDNYAKFQKVGLKLWQKIIPVYRGSAIANSGGQWFPAGETILQNKGIQMKINLLPYLGTQIVNAKGGIGFEIVNKGNGFLGAEDYVNVVGEWEAEISLTHAIVVAINLAHIIPPNE